MPTTFHIALVDEWLAARDEQTYAPAAFEGEGFIHCTDGVEEIVATANRYYRDHPGPFVILEVDVDRVDARVTVEDERRIYPHIHGRLPRAAVIAEFPVERAADGTFLGLGDASRP